VIFLRKLKRKAIYSNQRYLNIKIFIHSFEEEKKKRDRERTTTNEEDIMFHQST
jgi:hypothetical protein